MIVTTRILTFAAGAQQFPAPSVLGLVSKIVATPLRANANPCWIGTSDVTNDASGVGVVQALATPPAATIPTDMFVHEDMSGRNSIDPTLLYAHGTSGQKLIVAYFQV